MVKKSVKTGLIVLTFFVFATMLVFPFDSSEVDEVCEVDGSVLVREGGVWVCNSSAVGVGVDTNESVWVGNATGECPADNYLYGFEVDGGRKCRADLSGAGSFDLNFSNGSHSGVVTDSEVFSILPSTGIMVLLAGNNLTISSTVVDSNCSGVNCDIGWGNLTDVPAGFADGTDDEGVDTTCDGESCNVANTGTLDGYEAADLLGGNTFDQSLNTTDDVSFNGLNVTGTDSIFTGLISDEDNMSTENVRIGVYGGTPRVIFDDASQIWEMDTVDLGGGDSYFRLYVPLLTVFSTTVDDSVFSTRVTGYSFNSTADEWCNSTDCYSLEDFFDDTNETDNVNLLLAENTTIHNRIDDVNSSISGGMLYYWDTTAATYDGDDIGNYSSAHAVCDGEFSGTYMCSVQDILNTIRDKNTATHGNWSGTAWIIGGSPGYTADANDCLGLTSDDSTDYGRFWNFDEAATGDGMGWLTGCNQVKGLACCKNY